MIARVAIEEEEQSAAGRRVNDLVDARQTERVLRAVLIEIGIINTHPPVLFILFENEYKICKPLGMHDLSNKTGSLQQG